MPSSSLAAALAASKIICGQAATTVDTSVKNEDEHHPSSSSPPRRPSSSSLRRHNQANKDGAKKRDERETSTIVGPRRGKMKKHDVIITLTNNNDHKKKNGDESMDPPLIRREETSTAKDKMNINPGDGGGGCSKSTTKRGKEKGAEVPTPARNDDGIISTGQMPVFVCGIPGDGDGDADDGDCKDTTVDDHDGGRIAKSATKRRRGRKNNKDKAPPTSPPVIEIADISPSEIVFVCDVPSDGDDDDDDDDDGDGEYLDGGDGSVDDDDDEGDGADEGGECGERVVDGLDRNVVATSDGRQNNTTGGGGGGGSGRRVDRTTSQGPQFAVLGGTGGDRGAVVRGTPPPGRGDNAKCGGYNNARRGNDEYPLGDGGGKDRRIIPNLPVNTGAMPTPWSIRAQEATKNNNDVGIGKRGGGGGGGARSGGMNLRSGNAATAKVDGSGGRRNTAYPPANSRAEAMKKSDARDESTRKQSRDNDARAGLRPGGDHRPIGGMTSSSRERISSRAPHQPNPTVVSSANTVIESGYVKEPSPVSYAAIKLESTAIKGRWADEDSDNE